MDRKHHEGPYLRFYNCKVYNLHQFKAFMRHDTSQEVKLYMLIGSNVRGPFTAKWNVLLQQCQHISLNVEICQALEEHRIDQGLYVTFGDECESGISDDTIQKFLDVLHSKSTSIDPKHVDSLIDLFQCRENVCQHLNKPLTEEDLRRSFQSASVRGKIAAIAGSRFEDLVANEQLMDIFLDELEVAAISKALDEYKKYCEGRFAEKYRECMTAFFSRVSARSLTEKYTSEKQRSILLLANLDWIGSNVKHFASETSPVLSLFELSKI